MRERDANRAAELIKARDQARILISAWNTRKSKTYPLMAIDFTSRRHNGTGVGWAEPYVIPRGLAVDMLRRLVADCNAKLRKLGVKP